MAEIRELLELLANTSRFPAPEWMDELTAKAKAALRQNECTGDSDGASLGKLKAKAEKLLPRLDNNAMVAGCPEKRGLSYQSAELIRALLAAETPPSARAEPVIPLIAIPTEELTTEWADQLWHRCCFSHEPPSKADFRTVMRSAVKEYAQWCAERTPPEEKRKNEPLINSDVIKAPQPEGPYSDPLFVAVNAAEDRPNGVWKCGALNCVPPCRCSPPVPPNHKPVA